jgi:hypothetical protein
MPRPRTDDDQWEWIEDHNGKPVRVLREGARLHVSMMDAKRARDGDDEARRRRHGVTMGRVQAEYIEHDAARSARTVHAANAVYDATGRVVARRPGWITNDNRSASDQAYAEMCAELQGAWRTKSEAPAGASRAADAARKPISIGDAEAIRYAAYLEMCDTLTNAWRGT